MLIDGEEQVSGPIASANWGPPLQLPKEIPDPDHVKPDDWVEDEKCVTHKLATSTVLSICSLSVYCLLRAQFVRDQT